jgi:hypothetical protein
LLARRKGRIVFLVCFVVALLPSSVDDAEQAVAGEVTGGWSGCKEKFVGLAIVLAAGAEGQIP